MTRLCMTSRDVDIMKGVVVPEGYRLSLVTGCERKHYYCVERLAEGGGGMTIDTKQRVIRAGYNTAMGEALNPHDARGRGWQQKLVDQAVQQLKDLWEPKKPSVRKKPRSRG